MSGVDSDYFSKYNIKELYVRRKELHIDDNSKWLDLGCGDGNTCKYIKKYFCDATYYGIDISEKCIEKAKTRQYVMTSTL